jgi:hypothetical protein
MDDTLLEVAVLGGALVLGFAVGVFVLYRRGSRS